VFAVTLPTPTLLESQEMLENVTPLKKKPAKERIPLLLNWLTLLKEIVKIWQPQLLLDQLLSLLMLINSVITTVVFSQAVELVNK
jgi:hypothetical protein